MSQWANAAPKVRATVESGQIALQPRHRKLPGKMFEERIGDAGFSFRILEVYRIHLVRHGG